MSDHVVLMKSFYEFMTSSMTSSMLSEGVYDEHIFKVVFLAGGPGSGKSYVSGKILASHGLRVVNSDDIFTMLLRRAGLSLKMIDSEISSRTIERDRAKILTADKLDLLLHGRLGVVIDGTGHDYSKIKLMGDRLRDLGYDSYMVFVNTSLEVAMKRNLVRERSISDDIVRERWSAVQTNIGKFQNYFGASNLIIVDNNVGGEDIMNKAYKQTMKFMARPIHNYMAKQWIDSEKEKKRSAPKSK